MSRRRLDSAISALVLVRLGQELGADSPVARAIHAAIEAVATLLGAMR